MRALILTLVLLLLPAPGRASVPFCIGDCDGEGMVTIDDLVLGVSVVAGNAPASACGAVLCMHPGDPQIACLVIAVNNALGAVCGEP